MENFASFCISCSVILFLSIKLSSAADTITPATPIRDGEKLVSATASFELGFFSPGKSKNRYVGIWYKKIPDTVVWVANRNDPIFDRNGVLTISNTGIIFLFNQTNGTVWSSNMSIVVKNPIAKLLDDGNFVVKDNSSSNGTSDNYLWQSFDYPTDTMLAGMKLGKDLRTGFERYEVSWKSDDDPSPGNFIHRLDIRVLPQICVFNGSAKYTCTGPWSGVAFGAALSNTTYLFQPIVVQNKDEVYYHYEFYSNPIIMILKIFPSGEIKRLIWHELSTGWEVLFKAPAPFCSYGICGANSICRIDQTPHCECLEGYKHTLQQNQNSPRTCVRNSLECKTGDRFLKFDDVKLPDLLNVSLNENLSLEECEVECSKNCSCRGYTNSKVTGDGSVSGCLMWFDDLIDFKKAKDINGVSFYLRVPTSESDVGNEKLLWLLVLVLPVVLSSLYIYCQWRRKKKQKVTETKSTDANLDMLQFNVNTGNVTMSDELGQDAKDKSNDSLLPLFSLASVMVATENFSVESKLGEGGYGPVYKARLLNGQEVAVKRLSSQSGQGLKEFKNEMKLIAQLQHRNLVRLLGCCVEQGEKILIYEYLANKSLDCFLFDEAKSHLLVWHKRITIIEGIAQGLLYLHQYSRLRIIHRDLKASNILLDSDMNPKISDFGMARVFGNDELQGNTKRIAGTYGYMAPEYAVEGLFSVKSDVFSFGVLMLETLSSKKNTGVYNTNSFNLIEHAWTLWQEERAHELIDPVVLQNAVPFPLLRRYINVALLCVQENAADRPTMLDVVSMLNNEQYHLLPPKEPAFSRTKNAKAESQSKSGSSVNEITVSLITAR